MEEIKINLDGTATEDYSKMRIDNSKVIAGGIASGAILGMIALIWGGHIAIAAIGIWCVGGLINLVLNL